MASVPPAGRRTARRIAGVVMLIIGITSLVSGAVIGFLNIARTDSEGYTMSDTYKMRTTTCAYYLAVLPSRDSDSTALAKWVVTSTAAGKDLFIGWGWFSDVAELHEIVHVRGPQALELGLRSIRIHDAGLGQHNLQ